MALRFEKQIRHAMESAPDLPRQLPHSGNNNSPLTDKPDEFRVHIGPSKDVLKPGAGEVIVATTADLKQVYAEMHKLSKNVATADIDANAKHEGEHAIAAKKLGAHTLKYLIKLWYHDGGYSWQAALRMHKLSTSKLGLAVITAYPRVLSRGDQIDIEGMGYEGVREIGDRVKIFNQKVPSGQSLPLPLSYRK